MNDAKSSLKVVDVLRAGLREHTENSLEGYRKIYEQTGDRFTLLYCVDDCGRAGIAMPEWLATAFNESLSRFTNCEVRELGEAFDMSRWKNFPLKAQNKMIKNLGPVIDRINECHKNGEAIDEGLFEKVGGEFSISGSTARDYYYYGKDAFPEE